MLKAFATVAQTSGSVDWADFERYLHENRSAESEESYVWSEEFAELIAVGFAAKQHEPQPCHRITIAGRRYAALGGREGAAAFLAAQPQPRLRRSGLAHQQSST